MSSSSFSDSPAGSIEAPEASDRTQPAVGQKRPARETGAEPPTKRPVLGVFTMPALSRVDDIPESAKQRLKAVGLKSSVYKDLISDFPWTSHLLLPEEPRGEACVVRGTFKWGL